MKCVDLYNGTFSNCKRIFILLTIRVESIHVVVNELFSCYHFWFRSIHSMLSLSVPLCLPLSPSVFLCPPLSLTVVLSSPFHLKNIALLYPYSMTLMVVIFSSFFLPLQPVTAIIPMQITTISHMISGDFHRSSTIHVHLLAIFILDIMATKFGFISFSTSGVLPLQLNGSEGRQKNIHVTNETKVNIKMGFVAKQKLYQRSLC